MREDPMKRMIALIAGAGTAGVILGSVFAVADSHSQSPSSTTSSPSTSGDGKEIFRFDTFGDEQL